MKKLFLLAMVIGLLVSGCSTPSRSKAYWVKDGKEVLVEEAQKAYQECRGPVWAKDGTTIEELEKDLDFCLTAHTSRERHKTTVGNLISLGAIVPYAGILASLAGEIVKGTGSLSVKRCMETKGYEEIKERWQNSDRCMKERGFEWKEEK